MIYDILAYDVRGNARDGYEINNILRTSCAIELSLAATDEDIIRAMVRCGCLSKGAMRSYNAGNLTIHGHDGWLTFNYKGRPLCEARERKAIRQAG